MHLYIYIYNIRIYIYMHTHTHTLTLCICTILYNIGIKPAFNSQHSHLYQKKHIKPVIGRFLGTGFHPFPQRTTRPLQPATMRSPLPPTLALLVRPPQAQNPVASVHLARRDCFYDQNRQGYRDTEQCFHMFPQLIMIIPNIWGYCWVVYGP